MATFPKLGLLFFGADSGPTAAPGKYSLVVESSKLADAGGLVAVWFPERHFQRFGGLYGSPSVAAAAIATVTRQIRLRAGSVVLPLQSPLRVAEEWSMVDNLSGGRVDLALASGWHVNDFVLSPSTYEKRNEDLADKASLLERLWRGESVSLPNGLGDAVDVAVYPRPLQPTLSLWLTAHSEMGFDVAAERGYNILTSSFLNKHAAAVLAPKIQRYRARMLERHGRPGVVTLMSHTCIGTPEQLAEVSPTLVEYQIHMLQMVQDIPKNGQLQTFSATMRNQRESVLRIAASTGVNQIVRGELSLIGTRDACAARLVQLAALGVDEVACLIDFGCPDEDAMRTVAELAGLTRAS